MIQTIGKYSGQQFEDILERDLPYCEFMLSLKFVKKENKDLVEWLKINVPLKQEMLKKEKISKLC